MTPTALADPPVRRDTAAQLDPTTSPVESSRTAVDKAFELLAAFPGGGTTVGVSELARAMSLSKSTVFRLLTAMERNGFVERHDGRYRLGRRLHDIGAQVYEPHPGSLHELLTPVMTTLYERSRETVHLGVLLDGEVALLGRLHGWRTAPHILRLGSRFLAHCSAMGKAMLAHDVDATEALLARGLAPRTPNTIVDASEFRHELRRTRERGIAINDQEARAQLSCVAIALLDEARRPVAALAISGPTSGFDVRRQAALLRSVAAEAERRIRYAAHVGQRAS
jgi:DNA-binding IclR family transcriptional regulator